MFPTDRDPSVPWGGIPDTPALACWGSVLRTLPASECRGKCPAPPLDQRVPHHTSFLSPSFPSPRETSAGGRGPAGRFEDFGMASWPRNPLWRTCVTLEIRAPGTSWSSRLRLALFLLSLWWAHGTKNSRGRSRVCLQTVIRLGGRPDAHTHTLRNPDPVSGAASDVVRGVQTAKLGIKESIRVRAVSLDERRFES